MGSPSDGASSVATDVYDRPLQSLRISVIDRCDLRCGYCMPEEEYVWLPKTDILTLGEIGTVVEAFTMVGVRKVRLTGGEPLLRTGVVELVGRLATIERIEDLAMTTNGTQLSRYAESLRRAGLHRVTVSLDSLKSARFEMLTRRAHLDRVIEGIEVAAEAGFRELKINTVVMRNFNDDELADLIAFGKRTGAEIRFIEYMDVGGATLWSPERVLSKGEILERIVANLGPVEPVGGRGSAPAESFRLEDGTRFGVIASTTEPFCGACDRSRLTADGWWYQCLYAQEGINLREMIRNGSSNGELTATIRRLWESRVDRGAEDRLSAPGRGALYQVEELKLDPHREMHTRGG